ncbi:FimV/HubP family polar landmark protein [Paraburkholderia panacisoli]|nr:FimV/HubP family polar landmark protein [Paraburkholderia panacisoli]
MTNHQDKGRLTGRPVAAAALALALAGAGMGSALAAPGDVASAPDAASVSYAAGSQYTVRPGQSLNDVAIAVTQSHDRATLARATRALFDANPNAFMSHDPSRLRVGAVLTVPALDASGALAASSAAAQAAAGASALSTAVEAEATSGAAQVNAAASAASAASAAAHAAAPAVPGTASSPAEASSAPAGAAAGGAVSSAPAGGSQAAASSSASDVHEWSGAIQPTASEPAAGAQPQAPGTAPATAGAQPASQPRAQVSSLQQLLALKNRVLMELQKHGIGGAPVATSGTASTGVAKPVAGASSAGPAGTGQGAAPVVPAPNSGGLSQVELSIAAAVGAALVVLLAALRMGRRKREARAAAEAVSADRDMAASARESDPQRSVATHGQTLASEVAGADDDQSVRDAAALAAERAAAEQAAAERAAAERAAAEEQAAANRTAAETAAQQAMGEPVAERQARTDSFTQDHTSPEQSGQELPASPAYVEPAQPAANAPEAAESAFPSEPLPAVHQESIHGATTAASLAAAAELGADALPLAPLEPVDETLQQDDPARHPQSNDEPAHGAPAVQQEPATELRNRPDTPVPVINFTQQIIEPRTAPPFVPPSDDALSSTFPERSTQAQPASAVPSEFPRDAVDAFGSLDMPLPPRIESPAGSEHAATSLTTQPVVSPETTAQQAFAPYESDDAPHVADEIATGTAGHAAIAGLGAAGFGSLNLDFDLELPPSPAQPLPAFTQTDLIRIARNKLDLASEYIELGDLSGARALINEVIEADDPATRTEARALLSTLAPLS